LTGLDGVEATKKRKFCQPDPVFGLALEFDRLAKGEAKESQLSQG